ncbi:hypothetical protein MDV080 [Gallid alphaherpesvirus 2]|nr:hypothetical protein MDV001 [Gallid alphaherpesvirus 2]UOW64063.1 hypothetical protein MDV080 [Gallid alphaherpesvirus 2]UOW64434.1 hypothetical protein MDV001 [Gallid alphaherpesvirus 2]UOW64555.1 hypothetical protein MDV080 [Gallid alphaherpesvirus 2]
MNDRGVPNSRTGPSLLALLPAANSYAAAYSPANRRAVGVGGGSYKSPTRGSPGTRGGWKAPLCLTLIGGIDGTVAALPPPAVYSLTFSGLGEPPQGAPRRGGGGADAGERTERGSTANKKKKRQRGVLSPPSALGSSPAGRGRPAPAIAAAKSSPLSASAAPGRCGARPRAPSRATRERRPRGNPRAPPAPWGARTASLPHARPRAHDRWSR